MGINKRAFHHWILKFLLLQRRLQDLRSTRLKPSLWTSLAADQDPFMLGWLRRSPAAFSVCSSSGFPFPCRHPAILSEQISKSKFPLCVVANAAPLALHAADGHGECVSCLGRWSHPRWSCTHGDVMSSLRGYDFGLSALAESFLLRKRLCPSRPPALFLPGTCEEKAAWHRNSALCDEWISQTLTLST